MHVFVKLYIHHRVQNPEKRATANREQAQARAQIHD